MRCRGNAAARAAVLATLALAGTAPAALAQGDPAWQVRTDAEHLTDEPVDVATVDGPGGHRLEVYRAADAQVIGVFTLGPGSANLASSTCPTYQVDDGAPAGFAAEGECRMRARSARFGLGQVGDESTVRSDRLLDLMNGAKVAVRYHLSGMGYYETGFTLRGSKQAVRRALGAGVKVEPES